MYSDRVLIGGDDYVDGPYSLLLTSGLTRVSGQVRILDDNIYEGTENFSLTIDSLSLPVRVMVAANCQHIITIIDNRKHNKKCLVMDVI